MTRIAHLTESGILDRILPHLPQGGQVELGPGDDAAVLRLASPRLVVTTDTLTEGQDFLVDATRPTWIGARAAVQNLADVAAMGARPQAVVMALSAPGSCEAETLEGIGRGLAQRCGRHDVSVVGGDLGAADELSLTVTALGSLPEGQPPIRRSGARDGDVLAIGSTQLGRSAGGLAWVLSGARIGQELPAGVADLIAWHQAPDPDLTLGWTRAPGTATAMLDLSDGLVRDGTRLAQASGAVADLDPSVLAADVAALEPVATALDARGDARSAHELAWSWVLHGGEEHAMLATFPPDRLPEGFRRIGRIRAPEARENPRVLLGGELVPVGGFDHFA